MLTLLGRANQHISCVYCFVAASPENGCLNPLTPVVPTMILLHIFVGCANHDAQFCQHHVTSGTE
jgi:hypothetical protein